MGDRVAVSRGWRLAEHARPVELLAHPADDFVADFVGATKGLRRLQVTRLDTRHLEPMDDIEAGTLGGTVGVEATLEEALALMLRADQSTIGVTDGAQFVGVLTPNGVHRALRAPRSEAETPRRGESPDRPDLGLPGCRRTRPWRADSC